MLTVFCCGYAITAVQDAASKNLVKTDELVYNRGKENDSETQRKTEERRHYFAEIGKHMDDLTGWSGKRYGVAENVVTFAREISQNTGRQILFDPYIGEGELSLDEVANGSYSNGVIRINPNSENPVAQIIVHELTHSIEGTAYYPQIQQMILDFYNADVGGIRAEIQERYGDTLRTAEDVDQEMIAEFFEKKGITDMDTLRAVVKVNRSFAEKVADWLQHLATKITGTKEQKFILEMRDRWREALLTADDGVSISENAKPEYLMSKREASPTTNQFLEAWNPENPGGEFYTVQSQVMEKLAEHWKEGSFVPRAITVHSYRARYTCLILDANSCTFEIVWACGLENAHAKREFDMEAGYGFDTRTEGDGTRIPPDRYSGRRSSRSLVERIGNEGAATTDGGLYAGSGESDLRGSNRRSSPNRRGATTGIQRLHLSRDRIFRLINQYGKRNTKTAKAFVTSIDPTSFLNLVAGEERANSLRARARRVNLENLENAETPFIRVNMREGTVLGGDGLKRMAALEKAGVTEVTIVVVPEGTARNAAETIDSLELYGANPSDDISLYELIPITRDSANEIDRVYGDRNVLNQISGTQYSISRRNDGDNRRVSQSAITARSVARENNQTETENAIEENIAADREGYTYTPKSNRETEEQAWANREAHWYDEDRLTGLFEQVESAKGAELDNLTTELILEYVDAVNSGDMARASRIQEQRGKLGTVIGRALQTNTLLRKLTPEGFLNDATAKMNRDYARRNGFSPTKINDEVRESMKGQEEEIVREAAEALAGGDVDVLIKFLE